MVKITVEKNRASVDVLCWGNAPFAEILTRKGSAIIPSGFKVATLNDGVIWLGETLVKDSKPYYRFIPKHMYGKDVPAPMADDLEEGFRPTPTEAYRLAQTVFYQRGDRKGYNGALVIGCSYPNLQKEIKRIHCLEENQVMPQDEVVEDRAFRPQEELRRNRPKRKYSECSSVVSTAESFSSMSTTMAEEGGRENKHFVADEDNLDVLDVFNQWSIDDTQPQSDQVDCFDESFDLDADLLASCFEI